MNTYKFTFCKYIKFWPILILILIFSCTDDIEQAPETWEEAVEKFTSSGDGASGNSSSSMIPGCRAEMECGFMTDGDGQVYRTVNIGGQVWMAENMNYDTKNSNSKHIFTPEQCNMGYKCDVYGRLYNWGAARTVCPAGWHLPKASEWNDLINYASPNAGTNLKAG
ncbi:MAG: hypothetical protein LBB36_05655, partial [Fibromonadaceae bacterium]|nr:hypothetical protein [Fibromonadaceae bacterium]